MSREQCSSLGGPFMDPSEPPKNAAYWKRRAKKAEADLEALKRGEFICSRCGLRKDSDPPSTDPNF